MSPPGGPVEPSTEPDSRGNFPGKVATTFKSGPDRRYLLKKVRAAGEKGKIPRVQNLRELHNFLECCKRETENAKQKESILRKDMLP
ncbi:hypothetical protein E2320_016832 [Naja naja]|nr:hypothetical protein E2320_016832 [Naja naja]